MKRLSTLSIPTLLAILAACSNSPASPAEEGPTVVAVSPASGTMVSPTAPMSVTFSRGMMPGMEMLIVLHEGSVTGPAVAGTASWSNDRRTLTFTPANALHSGSTYVLHLAPGLRSSDGRSLNHDACTMLGARTVRRGMMGMGGNGPGMIGSGWLSTGGTYGMMFTFTTS